MQYLDQRISDKLLFICEFITTDIFILETLRKYPVPPFLDQICAEDFKILGIDVIIEKGTFVYIPMERLFQLTWVLVLIPGERSTVGSIPTSAWVFVPFLLRKLFQLKATRQK